ncbi:MAG: hypothetical protein IT307_13365 [Chloroflexi bacterium]|nr:hypothetical protein [Chloroflexota bacterium]
MDNRESNTCFSDVYAKLATPFETTFRDSRGGVDLEYITGEQCITRLNEELGVAGWSFTIREHGRSAEADEMWVLGEIVASFGGTLVSRQQFGSQKVKRSRASGTPIDIGFDLKAAATDALKKCAMLLGVGLYLSRKEAPASPEGGDGGNGSNGLILVGGTDSAGKSAAESGSGDAPTCAICGSALTETRFRDGSVWPPGQLAAYGRRKHNRVLCMEHYRAANEARRRGEQALEEAPF